LDCSDSNDPEGDELTYTWSIDGNEVATGVNPTIVLPCGTYTIELIVNDGEVDSEPDYVEITVEDGTPPEITCPNNITLECPADTDPSATGLATATDNCDDAPTITYGDATYGACPQLIERTWTATDASDNSNSCVQIITVQDTTPPVIESLDGLPLLQAVGLEVQFMASFGDTCGDVTATWDFPGADSFDVTDPMNPTSVYNEPGIYTVTLTVTDGCNSVSESLVVVVYDPAAGFTTGGGWFVPDSNSFIDGVGVTDKVSKANFGFIVKYKKGADNPDGNLEFQYRAGDIDLKSSDMEWLVVQSTTKVRFKGKATINGQGPYTFKVTAEDNGEPGTGDWFKIEIWLGVVDTENGPQAPKHKAQGFLGGGNIQIHQK
jgi:PKD repeat protein